MSPPTQQNTPPSRTDHRFSSYQGGHEACCWTSQNSSRQAQRPSDRFSNTTPKPSHVSTGAILEMSVWMPKGGHWWLARGQGGSGVVWCGGLDCVTCHVLRLTFSSWPDSWAGCRTVLCSGSADARHCRRAAPAPATCAMTQGAGLTRSVGTTTNKNTPTKKNDVTGHHTVAKR